MATEQVVITPRQPAVTIRPAQGTAVSRSFFIIDIILLFAAVIVLNLVIDGGIYMWLMTVFGAFVISTLLSAAGAHVFGNKGH